MIFFSSNFFGALPFIGKTILIILQCTVFGPFIRCCCCCCSAAAASTAAAALAGALSSAANAGAAALAAAVGCLGFSFFSAGYASCSGCP